MKQPPLTTRSTLLGTWSSSKFRVSVCIKRISFVKFFVVSRNG